MFTGNKGKSFYKLPWGTTKIRDPGHIPVFRTHAFSTVGKNKNRKF